MGFDFGIMNNRDLRRRKGSAEWSNRILILSLLGIAYLTLFPFKFDFTATFVFHRSPFLLQSSVKRVMYLDFFLNVLLFVPFGFGVSAQACKRGGNRWVSLLLALLAGAGVSYTVEVLQFYIPARDSGWEDVISNTMGSVAGFLLFELCGGAILEMMSKGEESLEGWHSQRRAALLLAVYFAACFGISVLLQNRTRLINWDPQCTLFVGNDASGQHPWDGQITLLQIWNRALPDKAIPELIGRQPADQESTGLLGSYDFTGSPPYRDRTNFLPELAWTPEQLPFTNARAPKLGAKSWLSTKLPVENLTQEIRKSNQFTVHIVCTPAAIQGVNGRIVSLSQSTENVNFHLRQEGPALVFYFRNPLSARGSMLAWYVRGVFQAGQARDIVAVYDGSDAFLYLDGIRVPQTYRLSPGASLMHSFYFIRPFDLDGCNIVFETLLFLPAGLLIGAAVMKWSGQKIFVGWMLALGWVLPAVLLEVLLAGMSGRRIWIGNIALSLVFGVAGILLINADRRFKNSPGAA
jgi:glycopeptide antibiotics resistance protein